MFHAAPLYRASLVLVDHSHAFSKEPWENAIDGDIDDWDGTATVETDQPWAIFAFRDGSTKMVQQLRLLTDTNVDCESRWVRGFRVLVSTTGTDDGDCTTIYSGKQTTGD